MQIIEKVAQLSTASDPVSGHAESVCKIEPATSLNEQQHQFTILTVNCLSSM